MGGGGSKNETRYTYVDNTQKEQDEAKERERSRLENERQKKEAAEKERIGREKQQAAERERQRFLTQQRNTAAAEQKQIQQEQERIAREEQRQRELKQKSLEKRKALFDYKFGDKINLASFRSLDINDVRKLRIGVFGPTGSGKSCFINTCERTVRQVDKGAAPINTTGSEGTIVLEDYLHEMFFRLVDTRGFFNYDTNENFEFSDILYGKVRQGDSIKRAQDDGFQINNLGSATTHAPFPEWLHGIILVVKANDIRLKKGTLKDYLLPVRQILRPIGISPVTVVTHEDTLPTDEAREQALDLASAATGSSRSHTFFVANYCPDHPGPDVKTELQIYGILHFALVTAERYVKIAKQQMMNRMEEELQEAMDTSNIGAPTPMVPQAAVGVFLEMLQYKYKWTENSMQIVTERLAQDDVKKLATLGDCWCDVKHYFPIGMRMMVEKELKVLNLI